LGYRQQRPEHRFQLRDCRFQPCERHRVTRGAATRVTSRQADRSALHPWSDAHPGVGADSLGMRGEEDVSGPSALRRRCALVARRGEPRGRARSSTASTGVSINAIAPGAIMTEMVKGSVIQIAGEAGWEDAGAQFVSVNPMRRFGEPNEVASLVAFLLSQEAPIHQGRRRAYRRWAVAGILNALRPAAATSIEAGDSHTPQETRCIECYSPSSASRSCRSRSS
jgi:hypothetical protein